MARIPDAEIARLNAEVSLERLAVARGVQLIRKGADLHGRCPFHDDRTPSLVITPAVNKWHCLGACQEGGDVIAWVQKAEGVSFRHAVEILREGLPLSGAGSEVERPIVKTSTVRKVSQLAESTVEDQVLLARVVAHYHETLKATPDALSYLQGRGLTDPELLSRFRLGFSNRTLGYKLPEKNRKEGRELRGRLQALGVLRSSGHEHLRGSLVVPLYDAEGRLVQLYGRKVTQKLRAGTPDHLYLPGPLRGVFNLDGIRGQEEVILCESLLDAMTFWSHGIRNVTTALGVGVVTPETWEALESSGVKRVLVAFDRDEAGDSGARKVAEKLQEKGIHAYRVLFPRGMDVNEYAQQMSPAGESLAQLLRHAVWMGEGEEPVGRPRRLVLDGLDLDLEEVLEVETPRSLEPAEPVAEEDPDSPYAGLDLDPLVLEVSGETASQAAPKEEARVPVPESRTVEEPTPEREASAPAAAYRIPPAPSPAKLTQEGVNHWVTLGDRRYRVRELLRNSSPGALNVNLFVSRETVPAGLAGFHVDTLNLYLDKPRGHFARRAGEELGLEESTISRDLGKLLCLLEVELEEAKQREAEAKAKPVEISERDREAALELLRDPHLLEKILADFTRCGVVGEEVNKLMGYLAATSRKLSEPLAVVIQSNSSAGKSSLQEAVLAFMPSEELVTYSAMTGQSLFYMGETNLSHKILAISEEEGAQKASYALKLLQSEGKLSIASTSKDPTSGRHVTQTYEVEGPVMIFLTTTATEMDEELLNRCLVLSVDEGREQTRAIHRAQRGRQTVEGLFEDTEKTRILALHQNAQRLLEPVLIANPYAEKLTFLDHQTRARRDHMKYLTLIRSVALLHQHQRERKTATREGKELTYIEVSREDIRIANRLAHEVLGRSLDELSPQTRRFLGELTRMVESRMREQGLTQTEVRFTRREVREWMRLGNTQAWTHLNILVDLEYLLAYSEGPSGQKFYELVYQEDPDRGSCYLPGLLDPDSLDGFGEGGDAVGSVSARFRPAFGPVSVASESLESPSQKGSKKESREESLSSSRNARIWTRDSRDAVDVGACRVMGIGDDAGLTPGA